MDLICDRGQEPQPEKAASRRSKPKKGKDKVAPAPATPYPAPPSAPAPAMPHPAPPPIMAGELQALWRRAEEREALGELMAMVTGFQEEYYSEVCLCVASPCQALSSIGPVYLPTIPYNSKCQPPAQDGVLFFRAVGVGPACKRAMEKGQHYISTLNGSGLLEGCPIILYQEGREGDMKLATATFLGAFIFPGHYQDSLGISMVSCESWSKAIWLTVMMRGDEGAEVGLVPISALHSIVRAPASHAPAEELERAHSIMVAALLEAETGKAEPQVE